MGREASGLVMPLRDEESLSCVPYSWLSPDVKCVVLEEDISLLPGTLIISQE